MIWRGICIGAKRRGRHTTTTVIRHAVRIPGLSNGRQTASGTAKRLKGEATTYHDDVHGQVLGGGLGLDGCNLTEIEKSDESEILLEAISPLHACRFFGG
jgi:hypothetical protein